MDQVYDALNAESPYDRCANSINSSIMLYKDGKDRGLVGGTSDNDDKESATNRFYNRLKSLLIEKHGSDNDFNIETIGTQVGRYMFNNRNDFVERAGEAFDNSIEKNNSWGAILGIISTCTKTVIGRCDALIKINTDFTKELNKIEFNSLELSINDKLKNKSSKLKDTVVNVDKPDRIVKCYAPKDLSDINIFLRDSLIATSKVSKKYSLRYVERYLKFKDILSEISDSMEAINKYLDNRKEPFKDLSNSETKVLTIFRDILKLSDDTDPFVFKTRAYEADLNTFVVSPTQFTNDVEYGSTVSDYFSALKEDTLYNNNGKTKTIYTSVRSSDTTSRIKEKLYASDIIGSGKVDLKKSDNIDLDLLKLSGDISIRDFYSQVQKYIDNVKETKDLKKATIECSNIIIDCLKKIRTAAIKLLAVTNKDFTNIKTSEMYVVKMLIHFSCEILLDAMSTIEGMISCNMVDNVRKLSLINLTNSLITWFDNIIRLGLGE